MKYQNILASLIVTIMVLILAACGSSRDSDGAAASGTDALANAATVGIENCLTCHETGIGSDWMAGVHSNGDQSPGTMFNSACLACHNQLGDGDVLTPARPVVGCESCHGGGQFHNGIAAGIPFPEPDSARCGQCHNDDFPHGFRPEGVGITADYDASPHARSLNDHVFDGDSTTDVRARCSKCHSDEGAKKYLNVDGDYTFLGANLPNTATPVSDASAISCRTCHKPHNESELLEDATAGRSDQFNTCTNCHQLLESGNVSKIVAYHDPAANAYGALGEIITDTHYAEPGTYDSGFTNSNSSDIAGYAMDFADDRVCLNCHNPHNADTTINEQWAGSKHADTTAAGAWAHYNWTETGTTGEVRVNGTSTSDRTSCQRCHTARGFIKMATETLGDTSVYVPFDDYQPKYKPEMLHCNACHTDSLGGLRQLDAVTADYSYLEAPDADPTGPDVVVLAETFTYPDVDASNICIACHTGRESGETIKNLVSNNGVTIDFTDIGFINSHYLTAGGTVFNATGYEYDVDGDPLTDDYFGPDFQGDGISDFAHGSIGTVDEPGTGDKGPCAGCHLSSLESHSFQPIRRDESTGLITAVTSDVCIVCHDGGHGPAFVPEGGDATDVQAAADFLNVEEEDFHASLDALAGQLAASGHPYLGGYPYFASGDWTADATPTPGVYDGKMAMGAAFNFNLLKHDPGAYVHNRFYTKRLIYDSIDYLDDTLFNESVGTAIDALVTAGDLTATEANMAKTYLDSDGVTVGVQRP